MTNKSGSNITQPDTAQAGEEYTRLHISPLDAQLLKVIVPEAVLSKARDISFHTIQTFPDKPYGFVEIPTAAAEKIKKKLNGAVLKGNKIRIEPARPVDMPKPSEDAVADVAAAGSEVERKSKKSKLSKKDRKRKRDPNEIAGVELEEGRKVKRGWTLTPDEAKLKKRKEREREKKEKKSSKDKKEKTKKKRDPESEYTEGPECLVKTTLPPNKRAIVEGEAKVDGGDDDDGTEKKKKSRKHKHQVVVHEFENNLKFPTFFKASTTTSTPDAPSDFVEGKGWVDDKGEVVQEVKSSRPLTFPKGHVEKKKKKVAAVVEDDTTSSSGSSDEEEEDSEDEDEDEQSKAEATSKEPSTTATEHDLHLQTASASAGSDIQPESASPVPISSSSAKSLTIRIPPTVSSPAKVHPLEALYKKQKQEEAEASAKTADAEPFSFFGGGDIEEEEEEEVNGVDLVMNEDAEISPVDHSQGIQIPMTPYSKQDFESRGLRSAAPTPDTAHPSRFSRIWPMGGDRDRPSDVEEEGEGGFGSSKEDGSGDEAGEGSTNPNTDFQKWFWEHRGDLNRSWKTRRKMAAKEKRYRENRARADRAI